MDNIWPILFWFSVTGLAYIYLGYPALIWFFSRFWTTSLDREPWTGSISVVLIAHNEASRLTEKLDSILASDCAERICEVLVGSDGSTDATARIVRAYPDDRVSLIEFEERRGKPACLNELIPQCSSDIIVLTDARQLLDRFAISKLAELFADIRIAAVSGELVYPKSDEAPTATRGTGLYWRYEKWIRRNESRFRSVPGANGAIYAIRRNVFRPIPVDTVLDDVVLPMQLVARGYHCAFEPGAIAYDQPSPSHRHEATRKRRAIAGCAQLIQLKSRWLSPDKNPIWWEYMSHKIARLFSPLLLVIAVVTNLVLIGDWVYAELAAIQFMLYLMAFIGWYYQRRGHRSAMCGPSLLFVTMNTTTALALWDAARGRFTPTWQRAA